MSGYVAVARADEIPDGEGRSFNAAGAEIAVFNSGGRLFAIDAMCTHALAYLHEGSFDRVRCTVECPLHGAEFDLATGEVLTPPAEEPVRVYQVRVVGGVVEVLL